MTIDDSDPEYANLYASHKQWVDAAAWNYLEWSTAETEKDEEDAAGERAQKRQRK